jgi:hypothetical protein
MDDPSADFSQSTVPWNSGLDSDVDTISLVPSANGHDEPMEIDSDSDSDVIDLGVQVTIPHTLLKEWITNMRAANVNDETKGIGEKAAYLITWVIDKTIKLHWSVEEGHDYITWLCNAPNEANPNVPPRERDMLYDVLDTYWANWAGHEEGGSDSDESDLEWEEDA